MTTIVVTGADLHDAAAWASRIVPARPAAPVIGGLLLDASDQLSVTAYDFDTCGTVTLPCIVKEPGRLLVSARLLTAVAKTVNRDVDVTLEERGGVVEVRCGRSEWSLPVMDADTYPQLPPTGDPLGTVDAGVLRRALARVLPAVAVGTDLDALQGVRIETTPGALSVIATDRYRLAGADIPFDGQLPDSLVPADLIEAALRTTGDAPVGLSATDTAFGLATATHTLTGRQIGADYPRWRGLVPAPSDHRAVADVANLTRALAQAQVMAPNEDAPLHLDFDGAEVAVSASDADRRARAEIGLHQLDGGHASIKVKAAYLRTALAAMESDAVSIHFHPRLVLMLPCAEDGTVVDGYRHLVMYRAGGER